MSKSDKMKWRIVSFRHPTQEKSVLYRQNLSTQELIQAVERSIELGANLMSIRGFKDEIS